MTARVATCRRCGVRAVTWGRLCVACRPKATP